jgi:hypothetical protein
MIVDYANDRPILNNLPLPGVAYVYNPNPSIRAIIGAPFSSLSWTFMENTAIDISTIVPWVLKGNLSYSFGPYTKVYTGLNLSQLTYFLHGRENLKERLFYDDRKIFIGAKFPVYIKTLADLEFGHAFDRSLFKAESYELNPNNPIRIENAFYTKISLVHIF